jgi:hypothetical protein
VTYRVCVQPRVSAYQCPQLKPFISGSTQVKKQKSALHPVIRGLFFCLPKLLLILLCSCSTLKAGIYLSTAEDKGEELLRNEPNVKLYLEHILEAPEEYRMQVFIRRGLASHIERTKLLAHSFYVIHDGGSFHTLSFYGTNIAYYSEGTWALDTDADMDSYMNYLFGENPWKVEEIATMHGINVQETVLNILVKMDSATTYYYRDHVVNRPNVDNCITALRETVSGDLILEGRNRILR